MEPSTAPMAALETKCLMTDASIMTEHTTIPDHCPSVHIEHLPPEMLHTIFRHLSVVELFAGLHRVNQFCNKLVIDYLSTRKSVTLLIDSGDRKSESESLSELRLRVPKAARHSAIVSLHIRTLAAHRTIATALPTALTHTQHLWIVFNTDCGADCDRRERPTTTTTNAALHRLQTMLADGKWAQHLQSVNLKVTNNLNVGWCSDLLRPALRRLLRDGFPRAQMTALRSLVISLSAILQVYRNPITTIADDQLELPIVEQLNHFGFSSFDEATVIADTWQRFFDQDRSQDLPIKRTPTTTRTAHIGGRVEIDRTLALVLPWLARHRVTGAYIHLQAFGLPRFRSALCRLSRTELARIRCLTLELCWYHDRSRVSLAALSAVLHLDGALSALDEVRLDFRPHEYSISHGRGHNQDQDQDQDQYLLKPLPKVTKLKLTLWLDWPDAGDHSVLGRPELAGPLGRIFPGLTQCTVICSACLACDHRGVKFHYEAAAEKDAPESTDRIRACEQRLVAPLQSVIHCARTSS